MHTHARTHAHTHTHTHTQTYSEVPRKDHNVVQNISSEYGPYDHGIQLHFRNRPFQLFLEWQNVEMTDEGETAVRDDS